MGVTQREGRDASLHVARYADPENRQLAREPVERRSPRWPSAPASIRASRLLVILADDLEHAVFLRIRQTLRQRNRLLALGPSTVSSAPAELT